MTLKRISENISEIILLWSGIRGQSINIRGRGLWTRAFKEKLDKKNVRPTPSFRYKTGQPTPLMKVHNYLAHYLRELLIAKWNETVVRINLPCWTATNMEAVYIFLLVVVQ